VAVEFPRIVVGGGGAEEEEAVGQQYSESCRRLFVADTVEEEECSLFASN
jgi:hypothetical protein